MGKELIYKTLRDHELTDSIPWVPFAGVHAGQLKGYTATEMLTDSDKIVECLREVKKLYMPDGMPILFDLQLEAEILGCDLLWADYNPPSVISHPLAKEKGLPCDCKIPTPEAGRMPVVLDAMRRVKAEMGDDVALYGLICGPFTLASHLRGTDIFMDMMADKKYIGELMDFTGRVAITMADMYIDAGMDVIAVVDPLISQVSPKMIDSLLKPTFTSVFDYIRSRGVLSSFFVCGNATKQVEVMCQCGPDSIAVDENVNLPKAKETTDKYNIALSGNIPLTTAMLHGNQQDNIKVVLDIIDSIEDKRNFIVSPGCDMPYDVPRENTVACAQAVKNPDSSRQLVENYSSTFDDIEVEIPDYANSEKVIIELFLLDPDQCAACGYMLASVKDCFDQISDIAEYRVYKYFIKEDIARTQKMGLSNLPTMCIDGEQKYISIIPGKDELVAAVKEAAAKKKA